MLPSVNRSFVRTERCSSLVAPIFERCSSLVAPIFDYVMVAIDFNDAVIFCINQYIDSSFKRTFENQINTQCSYLSQIVVLKVEGILFIVSIVRIIINHTDCYALWYFTKKSVIYVLTLLSSWYCKYFRCSSQMAYCEFLSLRTVLMALKTEGVNSIFFT